MGAPRGTFQALDFSMCSLGWVQRAGRRRGLPRHMWWIPHNRAGAVVGGLGPRTDGRI